MRPLERVLLVGALMAPGLVACGSGEPNQVRAGATTCVVDTTPSGPLTTAGGALRHPEVPPPADWVDPPQEGFDWDDDGQGDTLAFDQERAEVRVEWADGTLTVTGVRSDFSGEPGQPLEPDGDPFLEQPTESGPPEDAAIDEGLAAPTPAAVADVTGDDLLDLIVVQGGTVSVVVGAGAASMSTTVAQDAIGTAAAGWRNPPVVPVPPPGFSTDQPAVPYDVATVVPTWDLTGDGVADWTVASVLPRALGPVAAYAGRPCA